MGLSILITFLSYIECTEINFLCYNVRECMKRTRAKRKRRVGEKAVEVGKMSERKGKCIVICAGDLTLGEVPVGEDDFVIAVDGGLS